MRTKTVAVLPYDPAWKEAFERIKAPLWERLQTWLSAVEHVGSTSVEGLWAKPIIDLDLVLKEPGFFPQVKQEPAEARKYSEVKRQAAALFPHDIDGYIAQKDACVKELYQKCGLL